MSIIRILPEAIANRIAAGEVIERPASVVKELVENALDAGAQRIVVQARDGGRSLIQVADDGCGMDPDDALLCLEPHATSKIREAPDIERILTLGFRGEALPSIASVSRFDLQTRRAGDLAGSEVVVDGGTLKDFHECGCAPGTRVRIRNLFFNVPGRRKFLRSAPTETEHIQETVLLQALAHPAVAFDLILDDQVVLQAPAATDLGARVALLLGLELFRAMLPVEHDEGGVEIRGFTARPGMTRSSRREQRFFVNGRPAMADALYIGLRDAYHTLVMKGRYPPAVLYFRLDPERVDVNVHPAKREIRFRDDQMLKQITAAALRRALRGLAGEVETLPVLGLPPTVRSDGSSLSPSASPDRFGHSGPESRPPVAGPSDLPAGPSGAEARPSSELHPPPPLRLERPAEQSPLPWPSPPVPVAAAAAPGEPPAGQGPLAGTTTGGTSPSTATRSEIRNLRILGTLSTLYLIAESASGLVLIDQHAAHERILFEKLLRAMRAREPERQPLLLPVTIEFGAPDAALLRRSLEHFQGLGFGLEEFGGNTFLATAVPVHFPRENLAGFLHDVLDDLRHGGPNPANRPDEVQIAQAACKHAVKAEDPLKPEEIARLLVDLAEAEMPYTCPHGRPVMITLPHGEIERRFGRRV